MIRNYLKVAFRNMARNKLFTFINIFGLSVSLACFIILFIYTTKELSYDTHHNKGIYRITSTLNQADGELFNIGTSSVPIARTIEAEIPEIIQAARTTSSSLFSGKNVISYEDNSWFIEDGHISDTSLFSLLEFDIISGNKQMPLPHHNGIVLENAWVKTIFGDEDPIGKMVKIGTNFGTSDFEVTATYDKSTYDAHIEPTFFVSMSNNHWNAFFNEEMTNWVGNNLVVTYLKLTPNADPEKVDQLIHEIFLKNGSEEMKATGLEKEMDLQPVEEIHTDTDKMFNISDTTNSTFIYVLATIGILILILACVNYINLSTARSGKRSLEVGVRKVMGVSPHGLIWQFLGESFIIVLISMVLGLFFVQLALPYFNNLITNPISFTWHTLIAMTPYLVGFLIITGLVAGFYPSFYLASFKPSTVLKGKGKDNAGSSLLRKSLVVFQFVISISLISAIFIISSQVNFIKDKELGFTADSKLIVPLSSEESTNNYKLLKTKFESNAQVVKVSGSNGIPGSQIVNDILIYKDGQTMTDAIHIYNNTVDLEFPQVLGMELLSGNYFLDYEHDSLSDKALISESGIKMLGINLEDAPGSIVYFDWNGRTFSFEIVGVVNDIHQFSLHKSMDPLMYTLGNGEQYSYLTMEADLTNFQNLIPNLESQWKEINTDTPFEYFALNDHILLQYTSDFNTFSLIKYFAYISIIISCLGLYAMSLFMAEKRYREIGIRKTFGAGVATIFTMVSSDLSKLIVVAFIVSVPITWFGMDKWLETFAYKIDPGVSVYLFAGFISIGIGWVTIAYQSIRAAWTNPVDVLKDE